MERSHPNHKKVKDKSQISSSPCSASAFQDANLTSKCQSKKNDASHSVHSNVHREPFFESSTAYCCGDNDDDCSTSDFFKPILRSNKNLNGKAMKENILSSVNQYSNSKAIFSKIYHRWFSERQNTLTKLRSLLKEVHDNATDYYKTQVTFKELSYNSRCFKGTTESQTIDFFASLTAFVSDAASGITSFAQAVDMDSYQTKFQEIMDQDAKITKDLYASRSQCIVQYKGIEEVIRKVHPNTLTSTMDTVSDTLHLSKHWAAMQNAYEENNMSKLINEVFKFFDNACQSDVLQNVGTTVSRFVAYNPAALEACKSTGKAVYGAMDTFGEKNKNAAVGYANRATNLFFMLSDKEEVDHLKNLIHEDTHQSKLESQIEEAIDSLENEMEEMRNIYFEWFTNYDSD